MTTLAEIRERLQQFAVEEYYEPHDLAQTLNIMLALVDETARLEERVRDLERRSE